MKNSFITLVITLLITLFSACSVHKLEVNQGNLLEEKSLENLKVGMTKKQVRLLLGSPIISDPFHPNRWDYIYLTVPNKVAQIEHHITVLFTGDKVSSITKK